MEDDWISGDDLRDVEEERAERIRQDFNGRGISSRPERPCFSGDDWLSGDDIRDIQDYENGRYLDAVEKRSQGYYNGPRGP